MTASNHHPETFLPKIVSVYVTESNLIDTAYPANSSQCISILCFLDIVLLDEIERTVKFLLVLKLCWEMTLVSDTGIMSRLVNQIP